MSLARYLSKLGAMLGSDGKVPSGALASGAARANFGAGAVLQVVQTYKTDASSYQGNDTYHTVMQASITPRDANSKILLLTNVNYGYANTQSQYEWYFYLDRSINGGAASVIGDATNRGSRQGGIFQPQGNTAIQGDMAVGSLGNQFLDSPNTTLPLTYLLKFRSHTALFYVNRSATDTDSSGYSKRLTSHLTLLEIAG